MTSQPPAGRPADRVRLGIAGLGAVAQAVHLPLIERLRDTYTIDAIADLSPTLTAAVGDRYRVAADRRFGTVEELAAAPGLDAVAILTSGSHALAVDAVLDAGLPVFSEKPLAFTEAEMDGIDARLASAAAPRLLLGYMKLYDPAVMRAVAIATDRRFGAPRAIEVTVLHPSGESQLEFAHLLAPTDVPAELRERLAASARQLQRDALGETAGAAFGTTAAAVLSALTSEARGVSCAAAVRERANEMNIDRKTAVRSILDMNASGPGSSGKAR